MGYTLDVEIIKKLLKEAGVVTKESSVAFVDEPKIGIFTGLSDDGIPIEFIPDAQFCDKEEKRKCMEEAKEKGNIGDRPVNPDGNNGSGGGR